MQRGSPGGAKLAKNEITCQMKILNWFLNENADRNLSFIFKISADFSTKILLQNK